MPLGGVLDFLFGFLAKAIVRRNMLLQPTECVSVFVKPAAAYSCFCNSALPIRKLSIKWQSV
jgi:hypothetical protein